MNPQHLCNSFNYYASVGRFYFAKDQLAHLQQHIMVWQSLRLDVHPFHSAFVTTSATRLKKIARVAARHTFHDLADFINACHWQRCVVCDAKLPYPTHIFCTAHRDPHGVPQASYKHCQTCPNIVVDQNDATLWCFRHARVCDHTACTTRIAEERRWCDAHQPRCQACDIVIEGNEAETWCDEHKAVCVREGCEERVATGRVGPRCVAHQHCCLVADCTETLVAATGPGVLYRTTYCRTHSPKCQVCGVPCVETWCREHAYECTIDGCTQRTDQRKETRCQAHQAHCQVCEAPVHWVSHPWCAEHRDICRVRSCQTRVSWAAAFCALHLPQCAGCQTQLKAFCSYNYPLPLCEQCTCAKKK